MPKIVIQAGHQNSKYNSIVALRGSTGAPNEMQFNIDIRDRVSDELRKRGFEVVGTDANVNDDPMITKPDWDLFLAIHYDADVYGKGGGFVDFPEPSTDGATQKSQAIAKALTDEYFAKTKIVNVPGRSNKNTRYYYMWKYLSKNTPCALIECGVGMHVPDDWQTLHFDRPLVVEGIVRGICKAFGVAYSSAPAPAPEPEIETITIPKKQFIELQEELDARKKHIQEAEKKAAILKEKFENEVRPAFAKAIEFINQLFK
jgi:N-acetylmuramoyl-L-alanine amidase